MVYPNTYLRTFWNPDLLHEIFVAMSFAPEFKQRYIPHNNVCRKTCWPVNDI